MNARHLPDIMLGSWLWTSQSAASQPVEHALFRRDFIMDTTPATSEIQIAARCAWQLFVNGHFFAAGPAPHPTGNTYVCTYDISHLIQIGANSIALHATCGRFPATSHPCHDTGFWLQLVCDNTPKLWTDNKWQALPLNAYAVTDLLASPAESAVEILDASQYPQNWLTLTQQHFSPDSNQRISGVTWQQPAVWPLKESPTTLEPAPSGLSLYEPQLPDHIIFRGRTEQRYAVLNVSFADIYKQKQRPGFFAAETSVYVAKETEQTLYCYSATPFKLILNNTVIADPITQQQARNAIRHKYRLDGYLPEHLRRLEDTQINADIKLHEGWNTFTLVKWCDTPHSTFTAIFDSLSAGSCTLKRSPDHNAENGWNLVGPLKTPLPLVDGAFSIQQLPKLPFTNYTDLYGDAAVCSLAAVTVRDMDANTSTPLPVSLTENQTIVFDFGKTIFAIPEIKVQGQQNDILDCTTGEHFLNNEVLAIENGIRRNTATLILNDSRKTFPWLLDDHKGFRYLMLTARHAHTVITIQQVSAYVASCEAKNRGTFECSDDTLNQIWKVGVNTLNTTFQGRYLDAPTKDQTQCIPDAMIQASSAFFTHGAYAQSADALTAFARTQLETGELNALTPSSFFQAIPDFSLLWPVWLQKHLNHTGDHKLLQKLFPHLTDLLEYYNSIAVEDNGPLGDVRNILGNPPFLDLDNSIDLVNGYSTGLNAIYCRALFSAAWIAGFNNMPELQDTYRNRAAHIARQIHNLAWNPDEQLFADCCTPLLGQSSFFSWQTSLLAIYGGIATPEEIPVIWDQLFSDTAPYERFAQGEYNNPYFKYFILDVAFNHDYADWGVNFIKYYWGDMIKNGATTWWELYDPENSNLADRICSHCQGYATAPNAFLISEIAGLRPAEPGMNVLFFSPGLQSATWCRASVPTPLGPVNISWELRVNNVLDITITSSHPVDIIPVLSPEFADKAIFNVSDTVSILAADDDANAAPAEDANA